jgi:hypothetical protein
MNFVDMKLIPTQERVDKKWGKKLVDALKGACGQSKKLGPQKSLKNFHEG